MAELSYEESKALAADDNPAVRAAAAARADLEPEVLYLLAQDESVAVRRAVATNLSAPHQTFDLLVQDRDEDVREGLITKIAMLTPQPDKGGDDKLRDSTHDALSILAMDQIVRVRETMAAAFMHMDGVPVDVISALAVDSEVSVSSPVLEHSPILTDEILLEIIGKGTASDNLCAISRRTRVSESVSGAVIHTNDTVAIGELLNNSSAQIQEEVLDSLIDRAADVDIWHTPLVNRPTLPPNAPQKLAHFIAEQLFDTLKSREDMDKEVLGEVEKLVRGRLDSGVAKPLHSGVFEYLNEPVSMTLVDRLQNSSGLHNSVISSALQAEDHKFVLAALIRLSDLHEAVVKRIFTERNAKGVVALVWKAKLPASMIVVIQQRMARIPPDDVLQPTKGGGKGGEDSFPVTVKELEWNIQFYSDLVDRDHAVKA